MSKGASRKTGRSEQTVSGSEADLRRIPGVGPDLARHLVRLGCASVADLKGRDPEAMYAADCRLHGGRVDRCVLYVYRLAVYFAENEHPDPAKLHWRHWKD